MEDTNTKIIIAKGVGVLTLSALANVLVWFLLKKFVTNTSDKEAIAPSTYLTLQFGVVWTIVMVVAVLLLFAGGRAGERRTQFKTDMRKLRAGDYVWMLASSTVAVLGFYYTMKWFLQKHSGLSTFIPLRTIAAVIVLVLLGVFVFKEKLNAFVVSGLCVFVVGFALIFAGRFKKEQ